MDADDINAVKAALSEHNNVKALWVESLANPGGVISDLDKLSAAAHDVGVPFLVDNTMATPFLCKPIEYGADIVVHSTTKFLAGHGQAMGGSVLL